MNHRAMLALTTRHSLSTPDFSAIYLISLAGLRKFGCRAILSAKGVRHLSDLLLVC